MDKGKSEIIIGKKSLEEGLDLLRDHLSKNQGEINQAYKRFDRDLIVPLQLRFTEPKSGSGVRIRSSISFATDRVKENSGTVVVEDQKPLDLKSRKKS